MLRLMKKEIDLDRSRILFDAPISKESFSRHWRVYGGQWNVEDEWLTGRNPDNCPGMVFLQGDYPGNVLVDFEARTVLPSSHDIDVMWNGSWDEARNERGVAYVAGLQGWWEGKVGIEKSPEYKLTATTPLFGFQPGRVYRIQGGSIEGHCFIFIDGRLALEVTDPDPIDSQKFTKVGFEAYCSHIQIRKVQVRSILWRKVDMTYAPEF
jgi:hypothetical protein